MKKHIIFLILLINNTINSQIKDIIVEYSVTLNKEVPLPKNPVGIEKDLGKIILETDKESEKIKYNLIVTPEESYFYAIPILTESLDFNFLAGINNNGKIKYYQNKSKSEYREYVDSRRTGIQILKRKPHYKWELTKETKIIDGLKCYKAVSYQFTDDNKKIDNKKFLITAWYCPEIFIQEGPLGYGDLPGLILEIQFYRSKFTATKINLNPDKKDMQIDRLPFPKAISVEQYGEMVMGTFNKAQYEAIEESKNKK